MVARQGRGASFPKEAWRLIQRWWSVSGTSRARNCKRRMGQRKKRTLTTLPRMRKTRCHRLLRNLSSVPELQVRAGQYSSIFCGFSNRFNLLIGYLLAFYSRDSPKIIFVFCERRGTRVWDFSAMFSWASGSTQQSGKLGGPVRGSVFLFSLTSPAWAVICGPHPNSHSHHLQIISMCHL